MDHSDNTNAVSAAACTMAEQTFAQAIIADTSTGKAARRVAKYRPAQMILAATPSEKVYHQLALVWGVYPLRTQPVDSVDVLFHCAIEKAKELGSDYIVVGRPITQAENPVAAYRRCVEEFVD